MMFNDYFILEDGRNSKMRKWYKDCYNLHAAAGAMAMACQRTCLGSWGVMK
jgi:hypothetical protein